ncbi:hypothetical protein BC829DRAFT_223983 [Chytridium lagenaria]|nr:hypothetical protein BC829DRAFT_223983 [Chytridium lagenaria]
MFPAPKKGDGAGISIAVDDLEGAPSVYVSGTYSGEDLALFPMLFPFRGEAESTQFIVVINAKTGETSVQSKLSPIVASGYALDPSILLFTTDILETIILTGSIISSTSAKSGAWLQFQPMAKLGQDFIIAPNPTLLPPSSEPRAAYLRL